MFLSTHDVSNVSQAKENVCITGEYLNVDSFFFIVKSGFKVEVNLVIHQFCF